MKTINVRTILKRLEDKKILYVFDAEVYVYSTEYEEYIREKSFSYYFYAYQYVVNNFAHLVLSDNEKFAERYKETDEEAYISHRKICEKSENDYFAQQEGSA